MRPLSADFKSYGWAPSTAEIAGLAGIDPIDVVRFDGNVAPAPLPSSRPGTIAAELARIHTYPHGGYTELVPAIADYADVGPANVVLGAGADDLIALCARALAGPGDTVAVADEPTYPLFAIAAWLAGAEVGNDDPVLTFCCRPNNPTGALDPLPDARPLVVDEAYYEYCGETALPLIDDGVIVLRTFSKAFGLAGARVGYALADPETAAELNARQTPAPLSTLSAALAVAALESPPDVGPLVEERERLASALRALGLEPLPSSANFVYVPVEDGRALGEALLRRGLAVRAFPDAIRISVVDSEDDDLLLDALAHTLERPSPVAAPGGRRVRRLHATAETRIAVRMAVDGTSRVRVATGAGLYDHLIEQLASDAGFDLVLEGVGDLETGSHHSVEDAARALGDALSGALGDRQGIARYGDALVSIDDARAHATVDLGDGPGAELRLERDPGLAEHVLRSFAQAANAAIHVDATGRNEQHVAEAAFKAVGSALRTAVRVDSAAIPSPNGTLLA